MLALLSPWRGCSAHATASAAECLASGARYAHPVRPAQLPAQRLPVRVGPGSRPARASEPTMGRGMSPEQFASIKQYVGFDEGSSAVLRAFSPVAEPHLERIVFDFYET